MSVELLMNITPSETRVAYVESGQLQEIHVERESKKDSVGNIYKGKVIRILPGMQAAFVDIGLEKAAFLHASDFALSKTALENKTLPEIHKLVYEGQSIMVQVIKDPIGTKGARLTTNIAIASRYLVLMPNDLKSQIAVSQRIESVIETERLKEVVEPLMIGDESFIIRTAAEGADSEALKQDALFLHRLWNKIKERMARPKPKNPLYSELGLSQRILRDFVGDPIEQIWIDSKLSFEALGKFTKSFMPELKDKLVYYAGTKPIFDSYEIEKEIQQALERRVDLKSGGYLIFDQTEAMTTIDVNTGGFVGHRNLEETIFNTNIEATDIIARQLKLRNLGGIIVIDFIDMKNENHKERLILSLQNALSLDRVRTTIHSFSSLGLVEMTRKRTRESLEHVLCEECKTCHGKGRVKSVETICNEILREIVRIDKAHPANCFLVYASPSVANVLTEDQSQSLAEVELFVKKTVQVKIESLFGQEQYDVILM